MLTTINDKNFALDSSDYEYHYQTGLTEKLDVLDGDFSQNILNEIVLWKVNRYAPFSNKTLELINSIKPTDLEINQKLTNDLLSCLLQTKGVQLAMASTILRFKNPSLYQIIDQRVYRIIYGKDLKTYPSQNRAKIQLQIDLYLSYLKDLKNVCDKLGIDFEKSDRILYMADKRLNKSSKLR